MRIAAVLGLVVVAAVAACGPAGPGATTGPGSTTGPAPTGPAATSGVPTEAPVATAGAPTDAPVGALPDPCSLVTQEEASVAFGSSVDAGTKEGIGRPEFGSGEQCTFSAGEFNVRVGVHPNPGSEIWGIYKSGFGPNVPALDGTDADEAYTVGDDACVVLKGDVLMEITIHQLVSPGAEDRLKVLCRLAIARL
jgi:hypothetical protein